MGKGCRTQGDRSGKGNPRWRVLPRAAKAKCEIESCWDAHGYCFVAQSRERSQLFLRQSGRDMSSVLCMCDPRSHEQKGPGEDLTDIMVAWGAEQDRKVCRPTEGCFGIQSYVEESLSSARCYLCCFQNHFRRCSRHLDTLRANAKIKLPEEDGLCRGNNTTQQWRGLCVKSREAEELGIKRSQGKAFRNTETAEGKAKGCERETEITGFLWWNPSTRKRSRGDSGTRERE